MCLYDRHIEQARRATMTVVVGQVIESQEPEINYKELYEKTQADLEAVVKKKEELLQETKRAKDARRESEEVAKKAAEEKALKDGEFEKLWKQSQQEREELSKRLQDITTSNRREKIQVQSMRIATELADGDNAELLSEFVSRSLDKMADDTGALTADVIEAITNDFKQNQKFKSLLRGSKATGGGATGNTSSAHANTKTIDRAAFDAMPIHKRGEFFKQGGKVVDSL